MLVGIDATLFYAVGGIDGGSWQELTVCKDIEVSSEKDKVEFSCRGSKHKKYKPGMTESSLEFDMLWHPSDPGFQAIMNAYASETMIGIKLVDNDDDGQVFTGDFYLFTGGQSVAMTDGVSSKISAAPAAEGQDPQWNNA